MESGLYALHVKMTELFLQIGCPSYNLTSWKKLALIQKPSTQVPKAFLPTEYAEKTIIFSINALI